MYTIIFIAAILVFAWMGYRKGIIKLSFRLLSLIGAYVSAILFTQSLGNYLNSSTALNGLLGYIIAGLVLFIGTSLILNLIFGIINKLLEKGGVALSQPSKIAGAVTGAVLGGIVGILTVWAVSTGLQVLKKPENLTAQVKPPKSSSGIEKFAKNMTGKAIKSAISATTDQPEVAELTAQLLESPEESIETLKGITDSREFRNLFLNPNNQRILNTGNVELIKQIPAFNQLLKNPHFKKLSQSLTDGGDDAEHKDQMAEKILNMWARAQFVKDDPQAQAVVNDPQLRSLIQSGNILKLLNSQKVIDLFERIMSVEAAQYAQQLKLADPTNNLIKTSEEAVKESKFYKWVDENGRVHYSDKKPEDQ